jgi:hypothetical protein
VAARADRAAALDARGILGLTLPEGMAALDRALTDGDAVARVAAMRVNFRHFRQISAHAASMPLLRDLRAANVASGSARRAQAALLDTVRAAQPSRRLEIVEGYLREAIGGTVKLAPERVGRTTPFQQFGVDSLMMVSFRQSRSHKSAKLVQRLVS